MAEFRDFCTNNSLVLPAGYDDEGRILLRMLQGLKWDYQKTFDDIALHHIWANKVNYNELTPVLPHLEHGMMYGYKRDMKSRPIIIINMRRIIESKIDTEPLMALANYFCCYLLKHGMIAGKIENWLCIYDLQGIGAIELGKIKKKI